MTAQTVYSQDAEMIAPVKQAVQDVLRSLPDDCSWNDLIDRFRVRRKIEIGIRQADAGELIDHNEVVNELLDNADLLDSASE